MERVLGMGRVPGGSVATALRDGGGKDTLSVLFKQHVTRTMHYESTAAH